MGEGDKGEVAFWSSFTFDMPGTAGCVEVEGLVLAEDAGAEAVFAMAQAVVHVAEADEGEGLTLGDEFGAELGDRLRKVRVAVVTTNGVPVFAAHVFGLVAQAFGAVVADEDEVGLGSAAGGGEDFGSGVLEAGNTIAIAVEAFVAPFGAAPAKGSGSDDTDTKLGEVEAVVADVAVLEGFELGGEAIVNGGVVGAFAAAPRGGGVPGVVVTEDGGFGEGKVSDLLDDGEVFVAEVADEEDEVNVEGLEGD